MTEHTQSKLDILYKGKILGTCSVVLFTTAIPDVISYEIADNLNLLAADTWVSNFKPVSESGAFNISRYKHNHGYSAELLVTDLLKLLTDRYASISLQMYTEEITHGTH